MSVNGLETKRFFLYTFLLSASSPLSAAGVGLNSTDEERISSYSSFESSLEIGTLLMLFN